MTRVLRGGLALALVAALSAFQAQRAWSQDEPGKSTGAKSAAAPRGDAELEQLLDQPITILREPNVELAGSRRSLAQLLEELATRYSFKLDIDKQSAERIRKAPSNGVAAIQMPLRAVLTRMLDGVAVQWSVKHGAVTIVASSVAGEYVVRSYPLGELQPNAASPAMKAALVEEFRDFLQSSVAAGAWERNGGRGRITIEQGKLIVVQNPLGQRKMAEVLEALRSAARENALLAQGKLVVAGDSPAAVEEGLAGRLKKRIALSLDDMPGDKALARLAEQLGVPFWIDFSSYQQNGLTLRQAVSLKCKSLSGRSALEIVLPQLGLTYVPSPDAIVVTTNDSPLLDGSDATPDVLAIGDLVAAPEDESDVAKYGRELAELVQQFVFAPESEEDQSAAVATLAGQRALVIFGSNAQRKAARELLASLRAATPVGPPAAGAAPAGSLAKALREPVQWNFKDTTLMEVAKNLEEQHGFEVVIDQLAIEEMGVSLEDRFSFKARKLPLGDALSLLLRRYSAQFSVDGETVIFTSRHAGVDSACKAYPIGQIVGWKNNQVENAALGESLSNLIIRSISPEEWQEQGGVYLIQIYRDKLIAQTDLDGHRRIEALLARLAEETARHTAQPKAARAEWILANPTGGYDDETARRLAKPISLEFNETPLPEVLAKLSEKLGMNVLADQSALDEMGLDADTTFSFEAKDLAAGDAIEKLGSTHELSFLVEHGAVLITSKAAAQAQGLSFAIIPINDLERPPAEGEVEEWGATTVASITKNCTPDLWVESEEGLASIVCLPHLESLLVANTPEGLSQVRAHLQKLRKEKSGAAPSQDAKSKP